MSGGFWKRQISRADDLFGKRDDYVRHTDDAWEVSMPVKEAKESKVASLLRATNVDLASLRRACWAGIPPDLRSSAWKHLLGYSSCAQDRREAALTRKRTEYAESAAEEQNERSVAHQIKIDVQRTAPAEWFREGKVQASLRRILYCWAMRHPACGYVQGINDLLAPILSVFLGDRKEEGWADAEADSYWCLTRLLDGIQDNYTHAQPGIQRRVIQLHNLIARIDGVLHAHLEAENVEFIHFAFRWMNCLLVREFPHHLVIRMWDTYFSEGVAELMDFHVYVCAAFLLRWAQDLLKKRFQDILLFLQNLPTKEWTIEDIEMLLAKAFMYKSQYQHAPKHYAK